MLLIFKEASTPKPTPPSTPDTTTMKPKCKVPGWNDIEGHEIYLGEIYARNTTLSWFEADAKAVEVGGYLAEITSEKETKIFQKVHVDAVSSKGFFLKSHLLFVLLEMMEQKQNGVNFFLTLCVIKT